MTDDEQRAKQRRILDLAGQFDLVPTYDYKQQRMYKHDKGHGDELNEESVKWLKERAARADRAAFLAVLDKAPDVPPLPGDELP